MSCENLTWGVPRIRDELALLGIHVAKSTIRKYRVRRPHPGPQTWKTFIDNHFKDIAAIDFFTVHTVTFRVLGEYFEYYDSDRPHQSLDGNSPMFRAVELPDQGRVIAESVLGGLHHRYRRAA